MSTTTRTGDTGQNFQQITSGETPNSISVSTNRQTLKDRLLAKIKIDEMTGCWVWQGAIAGGGYAVIWVDGGNIAAHRAAYETFVGEIPDGLVLDHVCRNRQCVNPAHVEPVTQRENVMRGETRAAANVAKTHCPQGHPYDEQNTCFSSGRRTCRTCIRERASERRKMMRAEQPAKARTLRLTCMRGHTYTPENTYITQAGTRSCRECHHRWEREYRQRRAQQEVPNA